MVRWAIVGFGDIARKAVAPAIQAHVGSELVAICRRDPAGLAADADAFEVSGRHTDYATMLAAGGFDAVYVASPVYLHAPHALAAIQRGLHVLVEKPMALNGDEAQSMVEAAVRANATLGVAFYHRFYPINFRVKELVESEAIGTLIALHGNASSSMDAATLAQPKMRWRVNRSQSGGGPLADIGSHRLDIFHSLAGPAARVAAFVDRRAVEGDVEDTAAVIVQYRSGVQATLSSLWTANPARGDYEVWGSNGYINVPYARGSEIVLQSPSGNRETLTIPPGELHDLPLIDDFVRAMQTGGAPHISGPDGVEVQRVIDAAYQSAQTGRTVSL